MLTVEEKTSLKEAFGEVAGRLGQLESGLTEAAEVLKSIQAMRRYQQAVVAASDAAGGYRGFWRDPEQAREFGGFIMGVVRGKGMTGQTGEEGGYLLPTEMASWVIAKLGRFSKFRRNALTVEMGARKLDVPIISEDLVVYCPGEGADITPSDVKVGQTELSARTMGCLTACTRELEDDALAGIGEIIGLSVTRALAKKEDEIGFNGDGTEQYFGMTGIVGALRAVDGTIGNIKGLYVGTGNTYAELTLTDFQNVAAILPSDAEDNAKWYMSKKFYFSVVHPLAVTAGVANLFEILSDRKARFLLGHEVEFVHCLPGVEANSQICAILGDLQLGAYLGQRKAIEIATSDHFYFGSNRRAFRGLERIDVNVHGVGDTTEAGPIVALITKDS